MWNSRTQSHQVASASHQDVQWSLQSDQKCTEISWIPKITLKKKSINKRGKTQNSKRENIRWKIARKARVRRAAMSSVVCWCCARSASHRKSGLHEIFSENCRHKIVEKKFCSKSLSAPTEEDVAVKKKSSKRSFLNSESDRKLEWNSGTVVVQFHWIEAWKSAFVRWSRVQCVQIAVKILFIAKKNCSSLQASADHPAEGLSVSSIYLFILAR